MAFSQIEREKPFTYNQDQLNYYTLRETLLKTQRV